MQTSDDLRSHVMTLIDRVTGRRFEEMVADFPADAINRRGPNLTYSPWHLLEHLRFSQRDILDYMRDPTYKAPHWPADYWPPLTEQTDAAGWDQSLAGFRADREALQALIADPHTDLLAPMPNTPGHTVLRELLLAADHTSMHLGEFGILREVMQTWPPSHGS